ncbi:MAG: helix-hairpin-helix domain-containing protein [Chloroflexi bacterium]|nr:helix-hairpin-helix domain-containing protein [Chloroflexota bacterium]
MLQKYRLPLLLTGLVFAAVLSVGLSSPPDLALELSPSPALNISQEPTQEGALRVEVSGAVAIPGVYTLPAGSRLIDAISAAGGWGERIDPLRIEICLNLAAPLIDGSAIRVPSRDDRFLLGTQGILCGTLYAAPGEIAAADISGSSAATATGGKIDLNSATAEQLESLPGIGPVTAAKIVAARKVLPFLIVDDLRTRGIISERVLQQIRLLVTP